MRSRGKITHWKDDKGFGFITPASGGQPVFVHIKSFVNRQRRPVGNETVTYDFKAGNKGRARAERVAFAGEHPPSSANSFGRGNVSLLLAGAFFGFVAVSAFGGKLPFFVLWLYVIASAGTFVLYALDKSAARNNRWRTRESTLHLFSLIGGWPGALAGQNLLRHKSKKLSFKFIFWATVLFNCGALGWLFSPSGVVALRSVFGMA